MDLCACLAEIFANNDPSEDDPSLDFMDRHPRRLERPAVLTLRALIRGQESTAVELSQCIWRLTGALDNAVRQCLVQASLQPPRADYFHDSAAAYRRGIAALRRMERAVETNEADPLAEGMAAFEVAVTDIDDLVDVEARRFHEPDMLVYRS